MDQEDNSKKTKVWKDKEAQLEHLAKAREIAKKKRAEMKENEENEVIKQLKEAKKDKKIKKIVQKKLLEESSSSEEEVEEVVEVVRRGHRPVRGDIAFVAGGQNPHKKSKKKIVKKKIVEISSSSSSSESESEEDYKHKLKDKYKNKYRKKYGDLREDNEKLPEVVHKSATEKIQHYIQNQTDALGWSSVFPNYSRF
jgi:acyl-CoA reductase-like NAD-dependent aldehyde dehydrogenase